MAGLCLLDLHRLQPWVWFYALMFGATLLPAASSRGVAAAVIAAVYTWGGLNKLTPYFAEENVPWLFEAWPALASWGRWPALGYALALLEAAFGPALWWSRSRPWARYAVWGFHLFVVLSLWKTGWNTVVIPWNLAMAALVGLVFSPRIELPGPVRPGAAGRALLALAWILPALNIFGLWPETLSWKMYANTQPEMTAYTAGGPPCDGLAAVWQDRAFDDGTKMTLDDWTIAETHAPPFSGEAVFRRLGRYLCRCAEKPDSAGIYLLSVERWNRRAERLDQIPCRTLLAR
jgi:hypothetical protein